MAVFRINKTADYSVISNRHLREKEMSLKAKGLLSLMLALPDDWAYSINGLVEICKEEESAINSTLKELKQFGYLSVDKLMPDKTKSGRIEYIYNIFEIPQGKQAPQKQGVENQGLEFQGVENQGQLNTNISNTELLNTNKKKERKTYNEIIQGSGFNETVRQSLYEFIKMRNLMKKPMTDRALTNLISRLKGLSGGDDEKADKILNQSIDRAWQDVYELKTDKQTSEQLQQPNYNELWNILVGAVNEIRTTFVQEYAGSCYGTPLYQLKDKSRCEPMYNKLPIEIRKIIDFGTFVLYGGLDEKAMTVERNRFLKAIHEKR